MNRVFLILLIISFTAKGQQVPFYNHNFLNPMVYNPAYTGSSGNINAFLVRNARNSSFNGGAINNYLSFDAPLLDSKLGVGFTVANQTIGIQQQLGGGANLSYQLKINSNHAVRFGVQMGFLDNQIDAEAINVEHKSDPFLLEISRNKLTYNGIVGLNYEWKDLSFGVSVPQIIGNKVTYGDLNNRGFYQLERHYMSSLSYRFNLNNNRSLSLIPNALVRYLPGVDIQYDGMLRLDHQKWGWIGAGYKSDYGIEFIAGFRILEGLSVGYSYEYLIGDMASYHSGMNHEILLGYSIKPGIKERRRIAELEALNADLDLRRLELKKELELAKEKENQLGSQNDQRLVERNFELEDSLKRISNQHDALERELALVNEELETIKKDLQQPDASDRINDKEYQAQQQKLPEEERITRSAGYRFKDMKGLSAPSGYYVINGVFTARSNAMNQLEKTQADGYPEAYLLLNWTNKFYYVIIHFTQDDKEAINVRKEYLRKHSGKTWVLEYFEPTSY